MPYGGKNGALRKNFPAFGFPKMSAQNDDSSSLLAYFIYLGINLNDMETPKRKIAFCVGKWSDPSAVLSWAWLRQYFLHVRSWYHFNNDKRSWYRFINGFLNFQGCQ
jgi:hypothetical protein